MMKKGAKVWCFIVILTVVGLMFSGLIDTTSATTEKTTVSVTDSSPWFTKGTNSGSGPWYPHPYEDHDYISTYVGGMSWLGGSPSEPDCWARFKPYLSQPGKYDVYAYFFVCKDTSTIVPFTVRYDGGTKTIKVDQYTSIPAWKEKYLGTWYFKAGQDTYVEVTDATGEPFDNIKSLTIGAIKFVNVFSDAKSTKFKTGDFVRVIAGISTQLNISQTFSKNNINRIRLPIPLSTTKVRVTNFLSPIACVANLAS